MRIAARLRQRNAAWHLVESNANGRIVTVCGIADRETAFQVSTDCQYDCTKCVAAFKKKIAQWNATRKAIVTISEVKRAC